MAANIINMVELIGCAEFRPFRNVWMLEELGVPYQHTPARPRSEEAYANNPTGKIPALKDENFIMCESAAINTYLGDKFRKQSMTANLVPEAGTQARGRYEQYVHFLQNEVDSQGLWIHRKHEALGHAFGSIPDAVAHAKSHTKRMIESMADELLKNGEYLLGDSFSAADILFMHCLLWNEVIGWGTWIEEDKGEAIANLRTYMKRCCEREAYKRAVAIKAKEKEQTEKIKHDDN